MKIIEIELINHVVIPESFHVNLKDKTDVIAIDGLNGSGKSFLINNIHPLASNRRHKDRYAIRKGKGGLKRIVYELDNHRNLEIIHEYVVNGKRHSCKSYCNIIIDGVKEELNPTGHTKKFDELIAEYLYFDNDTFTCTFLSPKAESIVNATSAKRKDILKSTMKASKILEKAQSNNRDVITETNQTIKVYTKQMEDMYKFLPFKTLDEFDNRLNEIDNTIESLTFKEGNETKLLIQYKTYLNSLNEKDSSNMDILSRYIDTLQSDTFNRFKNVNEVLTEYDKYKIEENNLEFSYKYKADELDKLKEKLDNSCDIDKINTTINKTETEIKEIEIFLNSEISVQYSNNDIQFKLISYLNSLSSSLTTFSMDGIDIYYEEQDLAKLKHDTEFEIDFMSKFVNEYRNYEHQSSDKEDISGIDKGDNCNSCPLYNKFVKTNLYLTENRYKYLTYVDKLEELNKTNTIITVYINLYKTVNELLTSINRISKIFKDKDANYIVKQTQASNFVIDKIKDYISVLSYKFNRLSTLRTELAEYKLIAVKSDHVDLNELRVKIDKFQRELDTMSIAIRRNVSFTDKVKMYRLNRDLYSSMSLEQLNTEFFALQNLSKEKSTTNESIRNTEHVIREYRSSINRLNEERTNLVVKRKDLVNTSKYLVELKERNRIHQLLKTILEKKIPLKLLKQNLDFIEMTVNTIMEENDIQLSIDIYNNDEVDEVEIAVSTRKEYVEDIALCSSGELCLLGVVLNAVLMHIIGYTIISFDEMDSNLDIIYRESFHGVINSILDKLDIEQIFCVSHNISFDMNAAHIVLGEYEIDRLHGEILNY